MEKGEIGGRGRFILALASAGGIGYFPWIPGTAGTAVGLIVFLVYSPLPPWLYFLSTAAFVALACWVAERAQGILGETDSPKIVIDEVAGFLITMAFLPRTPTILGAGFLLFRVLDIIKPPPAGAIDRRMKNGWGVVLDDAVAGIYANILLHLIVYWHPDF
jgi:phosphatidylglycerophosphatase A